MRPNKAVKRIVALSGYARLPLRSAKEATMEKSNPQMTITFNEKYLALLDHLLPKVELCRGNFSAVAALIESLQDFYQQNTGLLLEELQTQNPKSIYAALPTTSDWLSRIKSQLLYAGRVIAADPLVHTLNDHLLYFHENKARGLSEDSLYTYFFDRIEKAASSMYDSIPLIRERLLLFCPIYGFYPGSENIGWSIDDISSGYGNTVRDILPSEILNDYEYLSNSVDIIEILPGLPYSARIRIPILDQEFQTIILRPKKCSIQSIEAVMDISLRQWIALNWLKYFHFNCRVVKTAIGLAESLDGAFWTPQTEYWNVSKWLHGGDDDNQRVYEFLDHNVLPDLQMVETDLLIKIIRDEEAFSVFRANLSLIGHQIRSLPWDDTFQKEASLVFSDYYEPGIERVRKTIEKIKPLRVLPLVSIAIGCAFSSVVLSGGSIGPAVLSGLASLLGFKDALSELLDPEKRVRSEPSYVLWKLRRSHE